LQIELKPALATHKPLLRGLLSDYLTEFEQYGGSGPDYPYFDTFWQEPNNRWPVLICLEGKCGGFAFVNTWSPSGRGTDFAIAEFYVVPGARRSGIGLQAAKTILQTRPGLWELSIMKLNAPARIFWPRVIEASSAKDVEQITSDEGTIFRFRIS
jgi:predicted acetyltransferase